MIKLLILIIMAAITLPITYLLLRSQGRMKEFTLIAAGAGLALMGLILQPLYPTYLVLLLLVCISFLGAFGFAKFEEKQATVVAAEAPMEVPTAKPVLEEIAPGGIPELKSVNQQTEQPSAIKPLTGMASLEPIRKEQDRE